MYFLIINDEDGQQLYTYKDKASLLNEIKPDNEGNHYYGDRTAMTKSPAKYDEIPIDKMLIIKGEVVIPKTKEIVVKHEIDID